MIYQSAFNGQTRLGALVIALLLAGLACAGEDLGKSFAQPPNEAKPWVYYWFEGGYGSPEGMARDIAAMKEKGIGGVMHMQTINAGGLPLPKQPKMLSPEWDAWFGEMLRLAHEGGMTLSASILDGWSHGGWWVGKEDGAKQLVYSETQLDGPAALEAPLPQPLTRLGVYRDVAVVAFKERGLWPAPPVEVKANNVMGGYCGEQNWPAAHATDGDPETYWRTQTPCTARAPAWLELRYAQPIRVSAAFAVGMPHAGPAECEVQASDDGKTFRSLAGFAMAAGESKRATFAETTASVFRLVVRRAHAPDLQLAEFQLLRAGDEPLLRRGIKWWDFKSANRAWWQWPPNPYEALEEEYSEDKASDLGAADVVDLTARLQADGKLDWQAPAGRWTVLRFGWTPLAEPARMGSGGYEIDVLNTKGADLMMDSAAKRMRELSVRHAGGAPIVFHTDSWEIGADGKGQQPTWTDDFRQQFQKRRGYDLLRYLPAMARQIVDDRETTDRFLRDFRDTVADLLADYYRRLQERAHQFNGGVNPESGYGSYPHPQMDGLQIFGRADRPMAEFWHPYGTYQPEYMRWVDIMRTTASGARIYGRRIVQAETLTYNPTAGQFTPPSQYRRTLHEAWARGLNQAVIHKYTHQPLEVKPGVLDYDIFNRHFAWWPLADGFLGYMGRCQYLLQQGDFVADAVYFVGEGASRFVPGKEYLRPALPSGFDYDGLNAEVLLSRIAVAAGRLTLPPCEVTSGAQSGEGMKYRYLVLCQPQCTAISPTVLEKINDLVKAGSTLVGSPPHSTPGLAERAAAGAKVKALTAELWGEAPSADGERKVGQGRVIWGRSLEDILASDGVKPDVEIATDQLAPRRAGLAGASWIWHAADGANPPPCDRLFRATITIPEGRTVALARVSMTVDNSFVILLNGTEICRGDDFRHAYDADVAKALFRSGRNEILVRATNAGDAPNPAGVIGKLLVTLDNGALVSRITEAASWETSTDGKQWASAAIVGPLGCGPWGQIESVVAPSLAWIHRRSRDGDIYFLANPLNQPLDLAMTLRAKAQTVQRFEPLDGSVCDLPEQGLTADGRTTLPLHFEPEQAFFVVFRDVPPKKTIKQNHPALRPVLTVEAPWEVTFDAAWVKPLPPAVAAGSKEVTVAFRALTDWSMHTEAGIKGYSGVAVYKNHFDLPTGTMPGQLMFFDVGMVKEMARVELNGHDLGVAWCPPWRVQIPSEVLKAQGNVLLITVANNWNNRLCADHALPEKERLTRVGHNLHAQAASRGLQPAGLLGPVRLLATGLP